MRRHRAHAHRQHPARRSEVREHGGLRAAAVALRPDRALDGGQRVVEVENGARSLEKLSGSCSPALFQKSRHWSCGCPQTLDEGRNVASLHVGVGQVLDALWCHDDAKRRNVGGHALSEVGGAWFLPQVGVEPVEVHRPLAAPV